MSTATADSAPASANALSTIVDGLTSTIGDSLKSLGEECMKTAKQYVKFRVILLFTAIITRSIGILGVLTGLVFNTMWMINQTNDDKVNLSKITISGVVLVVGLCFLYKLWKGLPRLVGEGTMAAFAPNVYIAKLGVEGVKKLMDGSLWSSVGEAEYSGVTYVAKDFRNPKIGELFVNKSGVVEKADKDAEIGPRLIVG